MSPAAAAPAATVGLLAVSRDMLAGRSVSVSVVRACVRGDRFPMSYEVGIAALDFEPRERLDEIVSVRERLLGTWRRLDIPQTSLKAQNLT